MGKLKSSTYELVDLSRSTYFCLKIRYSGEATCGTITAAISVVNCDSYRYLVVALYIATAVALCGNKKNHNTNGFGVSGDGTTSPLYNTFQVDKFGRCKYKLPTVLFCCIGVLTVV